MPGTSHSLLRRWSVGEGGLTYGFATDTEGRIYTATRDYAYSLNRDGQILWATPCSTIHGCSAVAATDEAVFIAGSNGEITRLNRESGGLSCEYVPTDLSTGPQPGNFLIADNRVVELLLGPLPMAVVASASDCTEQYRLASPNGQQPGAAVADPATDRLAISWDNAGGSGAVFTSHRLGLGLPICQATAAQESFRFLLHGGYAWSGWSALRGLSLDDCSDFGTVFTSSHGSYGDVRDISFDAAGSSLLMLGNGYYNAGLFVLDPQTLEERAFHSNFTMNPSTPLISLNKFAVGGAWVFVPDGSALDAGRVRVLRVEDEGVSEIFAFDQGRVTSRGDRFIDGGLYLTQIQRGGGSSPDTPLVAYEAGSGAFNGQGNVVGGADGNKHCESCLEDLRWAEVTCTPQAEAFDCELSHLYSFPILGAATFANLPPGSWDIAEQPAGFSASGVSGETMIPGPFLPGLPRIFRLTPR